MYCSNCGKPVPKGVYTCPECGHDLLDEAEKLNEASGEIHVNHEPPRYPIAPIITVCAVLITALVCFWLIRINPIRVKTAPDSASTASHTEKSDGSADLTSVHESETDIRVPETILPAAEPTPTPVVTPAPYAASRHSEPVRLTREDLEGMSAEELRIARNEIFAVHGLIFEAEDLNAYFSAQPWYKGTVTDSDSIDLSEIEYANLETILAYEAEMGYNQ